MRKVKNLACELVPFMGYSLQPDGRLIDAGGYTVDGVPEEVAVSSVCIRLHAAGVIEIEDLAIPVIKEPAPQITIDVGIMEATVTAGDDKKFGTDDEEVVVKAKPRKKYSSKKAAAKPDKE